MMYETDDDLSHWDYLVNAFDDGHAFIGQTPPVLETTSTLYSALLVAQQPETISSLAFQNAEITEQKLPALSLVGGSSAFRVNHEYPNSSHLMGYPHHQYASMPRNQTSMIATPVALVQPMFEGCATTSATVDPSQLESFFLQRLFLLSNCANGQLSAMSKPELYSSNALQRQQLKNPPFQTTRQNKSDGSISDPAIILMRAQALDGNCNEVQTSRLQQQYQQVPKNDRTQTLSFERPTYRKAPPMLQDPPFAFIDPVFQNHDKAGANGKTSIVTSALASSPSILNRTMTKNRASSLDFKRSEGQDLLVASMVSDFNKCHHNVRTDEDPSKPTVSSGSRTATLYGTSQGVRKSPPQNKPTATRKRPPKTPSQSMGPGTIKITKPLTAYTYFFRDERDNIMNWNGEGLPPIVNDWSNDKKDALLEQHWYVDPVKGKRRHRKSHGKMRCTE